MIRSPERQKELLKLGTTWTLDSAHLQGMAVDIVHGIRAWKLTDQEWSVIGSIGKEAARKANVNVEWCALKRLGGVWENTNDPAHWQIIGWRERAAEKLYATEGVLSGND